MLLRTPSYYNLFRCIADKCTDNCCIGWEIDIDSETAEYYSSVTGDFGKRLKENISPENSFILKNERCPFLNDNNLCDIIISCGENRLCQICRDHPRFFEWYGNIKEGGIGLSCEEGARLILTSDEVTYSENEVSEKEEKVDSGLFMTLYSARDHIFSVIDNSTLSVKEKLSFILDYSEQLQFRIDNPDNNFDAPTGKAKGEGDLKGIIGLFSDFEPIDENWSAELSELQKKTELCHKALSENEENYILNLCRYFIWRYFMKGVFDEEILSKVRFAIVSPLVIRLMCDGKEGLELWIEKSKLYSKEMEYSDENRELFYDYTYEKDCLCSAEIKGLLNTLLK